MSPFVGNILFGISLLLLSVSGNFVGETLGCKLQTKLSQNMVVKHILVLFIIFFSIGISKDIIHPFTRLCITMIIYVLYLSISKIPMTATFIVFLLLLFAIILHTCQEYAEQHISKEEDDMTFDIWNIMYTIIFSGIVVTLFVGIILYIRSKQREYKNDWSTTTFLFGNTECKVNDGYLK